MSYKFGYYNDVINKIQIIDYRKSVENYKQYIYDYFESLGYEIDVFFATNESNEEIHNNLIHTYKPKKHIFIPNNKKLDKNLSRSVKLQSAVQLCIDYANETQTIYDTVFITRFDLYFNESFKNLPVRFEMINISSKLEIHKSDKKLDRIDDNLYILPYHLLDEFNNLIKKI